MKHKYEQKIEDSIFPKMIAKVKQLRTEFSPLSAKIGYQIRRMSYDRRLFVLVSCKPELNNQMSDKIKQTFPEARMTSKMEDDTGNNTMVFSTMM